MSGKPVKLRLPVGRRARPVWRRERPRPGHLETDAAAAQKRAGHWRTVNPPCARVLAATLRGLGSNTGDGAGNLRSNHLDANTRPRGKSLFAIGTQGQHAEHRALGVGPGRRPTPAALPAPEHFEVARYLVVGT